MSIYLSAHFTVEECKCKCKRHVGDYCYVQPKLLVLVEKIRAILKTPLEVNSCCRCPDHNREEKGSPTSKHITLPLNPSRAMDIKPRHMSALTAYNEIMKAYQSGQLEELGGIGIYDSFVHVDTAKAADGHLRKWDERTKRP